jgi:endonuclease/exonuclease/phosphatase family metal-dependent hydrolase
MMASLAFALAVGLCLLALSSSAATVAALEPPRPLRFVTFNLFHGGPLSGLNGDAGSLDHRLTMVAEELRDLQPDVVGLQEASKGWGRGNIAARLAGQLGFHHVYAPANPRLFNNDAVSGVLAVLMNFSEGPAILSRFPIVAWDAHELPRCGKRFEARRLLGAVVETPWGKVRVFSAHTTGSACQTQAVAARVLADRGILPSVLMGDFNAVEDSPALSVFFRDAGFIDAFRSANPDEPGFTVWQRLDETAPTVRRRVDYVFLVPGEATAESVRSSRLILNRPRRLSNGKTMWLSDHYGVMAEIDLLPPAPRDGGPRAAEARQSSRAPLCRHRRPNPRGVSWMSALMLRG